MNIQTFTCGPISTNCYLVSCPDTAEVAIIDAPPGLFETIQQSFSSQELSKFISAKLILTHSHWDHAVDAALLKDKLNVQIYLHELDVDNLVNPGADQLPCPIAYSGVNFDNLIKEGDVIEVGKYKFVVMHTPGHTPGSICLHEKSSQVLISGDTLFDQSYGKISFPTSQPRLMPASLAKLAKLPASTKFYPGHGPTSTILQQSWLKTI